jgi:hypothetical protein
MYSYEDCSCAEHQNSSKTDFRCPDPEILGDFLDDGSHDEDVAICFDDINEEEGGKEDGGFRLVPNVNFEEIDGSKDGKDLAGHQNA